MKMQSVQNGLPLFCHELYISQPAAYAAANIMHHQAMFLNIR
jgi:hypothetical protein